MRTFDLSPLYRATVGFDRVADLSRMAGDAQRIDELGQTVRLAGIRHFNFSIDPGDEVGDIWIGCGQSGNGFIGWLQH